MNTKYIMTSDITMPAKKDNCNIEVLGDFPNDKNYILLGIVKTTDPGLAIGCDYNESIKLLKEKARSVGGEALVNVRKYNSSLESTCDLLEASVIVFQARTQSKKLTNRTVSVDKPLMVKDRQINIAVIDFDGKNTSQANASIISDFIRTDLVRIGNYNIIEKANMDKILAEQAFQATGCTTTQCIIQMGKILNVQQMIVGTLSELMGTYYITANLIDVETGKIIKSEDVKINNTDEIKNACRELAEKLSSE